jgi:sialidase-1
MLGFVLQRAFPLKRTLTSLADARLVSALLGLTLLATAPAQAVESYSRVKLFDGITGGGAGTYHSYRIPSIVRTKNGHLLAFCEGRKTSTADFGQNIDIVMRRAAFNSSAGTYNSWSGQTIVLGNDSPDQWTWSNPTALVDLTQGTNGRVWLFVNRQLQTYTTAGSIPVGARYTLTIYSDDEGVTWQGLTDRTTALGGHTIQFDYVGPGVGIQKTEGAVAGQLVVPAKERNFYSNTHGSTWSVCPVPGNPYDPAVGTTITPTESTIAELTGGLLLRNDRIVNAEWNYDPGTSGNLNHKRRYESIGTNEAGFSDFMRDDALLDVNCEGSTWLYNANSPRRLMFLNSASTVTRTKMMVFISYDNGATWPRSRYLYLNTPPDNFTTHTAIQTAGKGGYSSMTKTADYHIGALVEINEPATGNRSMDYHRFNLAWILEGEPDGP